MLLLKQDITRKKRVNSNKLVLKLEFKASGDKDYNIEAIRDNVVYANKAKS